MDRAIKAWTGGSTSNVADSLKLSYTVYECMILLSPNAFESPAWQAYRKDDDKIDFRSFYVLLCHHLQVTHIAMNKPIPVLKKDDSSENIVRSPSNFTPLYGDFGPAFASSPPSSSDFEAAFWVMAKQNGIFQTWAPRWTMFSRGNISEKARLLSLPSVTEAVDQGKLDGKGSAAVDLYAGIGYFAFCYLKAGVDKVLCWDLNSWSVEGLRRGALANKWSATLSRDGSSDDLAGSQTRLLVFDESNELAVDRVRSMRHELPPIRHVNCGLLPTSRGSWQTAVETLSCELGGWVHVHENFAIAEIDQRADDVQSDFQRLATQDGRMGNVKVEHVNRLKSYAPGVMHCVVDLYIPPSPPIQ